MKLKSPIRVVLEVTDKCNYACEYCFNSCSPDNMNKDEITTERWKSIIKEMRDEEVFEISFTGGEPFFRKDIFELISYGNELDFDFTINTNASLLNKEKIEKLKSVFGKKTSSVRIMVALDTLNDKRYKSITNAKVDVKRVKKNIKKLCNCGFKVTITSILSKRTAEDYQELLEFFLKSEVKGWNISDIIPYGRGARCNYLLPSKQDWQKVKKLLKENRNKIKEQGKKVSVKSNRFDKNKGKRKCGDSFKCPAGKTEMSVGPNGKFSPCIAFRGTRASSEQDSLKRYWEEDKFIDKLRERDASSLKSICSECNLKEDCVGGCPGLALRYFNSINMPDPRCLSLPVIEEAEAEENLNFVTGLTKENMKEYYSESEWENVNEEIKEEAEKENNVLWIIKKNGKKVGYLMFEKKQEGIFIISMQIKKEFQNEGYGTLLLKRLEGYSVKEGFRKIELEVRRDNEKAVNFYKKENYKNIGSYDDKLILEKDLYGNEEL